MKIQVVFQNLQKSEFVTDLVIDRVRTVLEKFPQNHHGKAVVYVSMENSPRHSGSTTFGVKIFLTNTVRKTLVFSKKSGTLFQAMAEVADGLFENLSRQNEILLRRERDSERRWKRLTHAPTAFFSEAEAS